MLQYGPCDSVTVTRNCFSFSFPHTDNEKHKQRLLIAVFTDIFLRFSFVFISFLILFLLHYASVGCFAHLLLLFYSFLFVCVSVCGDDNYLDHCFSFSFISSTSIFFSFFFSLRHVAPLSHGCRLS